MSMAEIIREPKPKQRELVVKHDIVIPAGTRLMQAPTKTERCGFQHYVALVGLSNDVCGSFIFDIADLDADSFDKYFLEIID